MSLVHNSEINRSSATIERLLVPSGITLVASPSLTPEAGCVAYETASGTLYYANGTNWLPLETSTPANLFLTTFGSTPNANALTLTGQVLNMEPASASFPGGVSTTTQSFAGVKTFTNSIILPTLSSVGVVHNDASGILSTSLIVNADIHASAAIVDTKLATIATAGKVSNSATTATFSNVINTIVARDGTGNFSATTITADLIGNATTATSTINFSGLLSGDVTGPQGTTVVALVGGLSAALTAAGATLANNSTSANTSSTIVRRDASGSFTAGDITLIGNLALPHTSSPTVGVITKGGDRFLSDFGTNIFMGTLSGNYNNSANCIVIGNNAGSLLDTGSYESVGIGNSVFAAHTVYCQSNTAIGHLSQSGSNNALSFECTSVGANSIESECGSRNNAFGAQSSMYLTSVAEDNCAFGNETLGRLSVPNSPAKFNNCFGNLTLTNNYTGLRNNAFGYGAMKMNVSGNNCCAFGEEALFTSASTNDTCAFGYHSLRLATGAGNSAFGYNTLAANVTGTGNSAFGYNSLPVNTASNNTAFGASTMLLVTTGVQNVAVGTGALATNVASNWNTAIGNAALSLATSAANTAVGSNALVALTIGGSNVAVGRASLQALTTTSNCVAVGTSALAANTAGNMTAVGFNALALNTSGGQNTAIGYNTLATNLTGASNTAVGYDALNLCTGASNTAVGSTTLNTLSSGSFNTGVGANALTAMTTLSNCTAIGYNALVVGTGAENTACGSSALGGCTTGNQNTAVGYVSLLSIVSGAQCAAVGYASLQNSTGGLNTALGWGAGSTITSGTGNICIGVSAGNTLTTGSSNIYIGLGSSSAAEANTCKIGSIRGVTTAAADAVAVLISSTGQLGTVSSTRDTKMNIISIDEATNSTIINSLIPRRFDMRQSVGTYQSYGLIVDEVESICPDLIARNADGSPMSIFYQHLPIMNLTEIQRLNKVIDSLIVRLNILEGV